jgi:CPA1 family monovalent cation:H+ antiporter
VAHLEISPEVVLFVFLPTLIFESAFNLDTRDLRENLVPVLTLAVPGLLLSTFVIGLFVRTATPLVGIEVTWPLALLLGSVLSATDPVAVIALFRQLGAPRRLTVLVEGESLFNDATAIVLSRILVGFALANAVASTPGTVLASVAVGALDFAAVFFGGLLVGWALAVLAGTLLGRIEADAFLEISLTTILAYASFLVAEHVLHVSGVMAVVAAGMLIGGWGEAKISPSIAGSLEHFWEYLAGVANALVFLMVGLRVELGALAASLPVLAWVVVGMLVSRTLIIHGGLPLLSRLPGTEPVDHRYRTVMVWGGLRGAVALAIVLALPRELGPDLLDLFVAVSIGAVLFTLLVQGLTVERLVRYFELHVPPLSDRVARLEGLITAKGRTLSQIPELLEGGLFSPRIAEQVRERCAAALEHQRGVLEGLRERELDLGEERRILYLRCFGEEKTLYYGMFSRGHLSEHAYRDLTHSLQLQTEGIRHEGKIPEYTLHPPAGERLENSVFRTLDRVPGLAGAAESLRAGRAARDYEVAWARSRGSRRVLSDLDEMADQDHTRTRIVEEVRAFYQYWHENARARLDQTAEQFPEFVGSTQERLADRLVLHAERDAIEEKARAGIIPPGVAEAMLEEMADELRDLRASRTEGLRVSPVELLRKVPFFMGLPEDEFQRVADHLRRRTAPAGELVVRQGGGGSVLYLVARGVVRVSVQEGDTRKDIATLMAGDFFGEMALLHGGPRTADCQAVTPCALYELRRDDVMALRDTCPAMQEALEEADRQRRAELQALAAPPPPGAPPHPPS